MADGYLDFLEAKAIAAPATGFHVEQDELQPWLTLCLGRGGVR